MLRELRGALTAFAIVAAIAVAAVSFNVGFPGQQLLQSLRFHLAGGVLVLAIALLASGAWWRGVLFLVVAVASATEGGLIIQQQQDVRQAVASQPSRPLLRLLSFNVLNSNTQGAELADYIVESGADVVMLLEATPLEEHQQTLAAVYPYRAACPNWCEMAILSKTPLTDIRSGSLGPVWSNRLASAATEIDGTRVNLVLAHLVKPYFDDLAAGEVYVLASALEKLEGPVVLGGDLNAAAWSDNIARLTRWRELAPGPTYPATWPVEAGALGIPIDNVFTRAPLLVTDIRATEDAWGSNHRGLIAEIALAEGS